MIKSKIDGSLIVISGPTSAGKGTICGELAKKYSDMYFSVSMTTRYARGTEVDGKDYFFVSKSEFEERIQNGDFLEYAEVHHGNYYGTPKSLIMDKLAQGIDVVLEIDIQGALQVKEKVKDAIFIFIMPPNIRTLIERLIKRGTEDIDKMIERVTRSYKEINEISTYNYVVVNDNLEDAVSKIEAILASEKCRVDRIEDIEIGNMEEAIHELLMK